MYGELKLSECITYGVSKTTLHKDFYSCSGACTHSQTFNVFVLFFPFVYSPFYSYIWPNWFSTVCSEWSSFNGSIVSLEIMFFGGLKKKIPGYKESLFVLNHLIHIFNIYMHNIYIYYWYILLIYILAFFRHGRSVRLIRLEKRSLSVGKNFGLAKTLFQCMYFSSFTVFFLQNLACNPGQCLSFVYDPKNHPPPPPPGGKPKFYIASLLVHSYELTLFRKFTTISSTIAAT